MQLDEYRRMAEVEDAMWYYRALHAHLERELAAALPQCALANAGDSAGQPLRRGPWRILDAGCGTGGLIRRLSPGHPDWLWTGIDLEPLACEFARARCAAAIVQGSVSALPFADGTFDAVASADVLCQVEDDGAVLREFARVLQPGGVLVINVPAYPWLWSYHDEAVQSRRRFLRRELAAKLADAGLLLRRLTHWNLVPFPLVVIRRKLLPAPRSGSDVRLFPRPVEAALNVAMSVERAWLRWGGSMPAGSSLLAVASKPAPP